MLTILTIGDLKTIGPRDNRKAHRSKIHSLLKEFDSENQDS
jgi:hypothetical protein